MTIPFFKCEFDLSNSVCRPVSVDDSPAGSAFGRHPGHPDQSGSVSMSLAGLLLDLPSVPSAWHRPSTGLASTLAEPLSRCHVDDGRST